MLGEQWDICDDDFELMLSVIVVVGDFDLSTRRPDHPAVALARQSFQNHFLGHHSFKKNLYRPVETWL